MKRKNKSKQALCITVVSIVVIVVALGYYYFFSALSVNNEKQFLYIDNDDNIDSVYAKLSPMANKHSMIGFKSLVSISSYSKNIKTGRYEITKDNGSLAVFRKLKSGLQAAVNLTIPSVRTKDKLAGMLSKKLMIDSLSILHALNDSNICKKYNYTPSTIVCMFIPNTYDVYWNISLPKFLDQMNTESKNFWNYERTKKAEALKLSKTEVITLASIVDEETANNTEKPMIAGMYYNRLMTNMPLQADPTIKFALQNFDIKRIYHNMLTVNSPYNTYTNIGLPPGPIRIPTVAGIDAVLNRVHHPYLYMCAKEDFSGTHNFARTYQEHLQNAAKYTKALNSRGIK